LTEIKLVFEGNKKEIVTVISGLKALWSGYSKASRREGYYATDVVIVDVIIIPGYRRRSP
jgi:hypothetical protein